MRLAMITAGAAGMYCGSCLRDNTLAAALHRLGHDALLVPTYTPIRTDEEDVSHKRVFFGGVNVYLQQKLSLFRHTPWLFDRVFDVPRLLRWVSRFAVSTQAEFLGDLTVSMLEGDHGRQRKEVRKLVAWLADDVKPELVTLTNVLLSGMLPDLKRWLKVPVVATLQGDDIYLESLPPPAREKCLALIRERSRHIAGYIATSHYYAEFMSGYLDIPREKIRVVWPGIELKGHGGPRPELPPGTPLTIGYFARICPEKGLHQLVDAFIMLKQMAGTPPCRLRVAGWLGGHQKAYLTDLKRRLAEAGLTECFEHLDCPSRADKVRFLQSLDVMSVPTVYREPKGLYVLEALANGVPVVQPRHGSFPELIEATGGGLLVEPGQPAELAKGLRRLLDDASLRQELGTKGRAAVRERFNAEEMARRTAEVLGKFLEQGGGSAGQG